MKDLYVCTFIVIALLTSCGQGKENQNQPGDIPATAKTSGNRETTVPGVEQLEFTDTVALKAGENMRFDKELFRVKAGKKLRLMLTNTARKSGLSMTHNVVILTSGTDIADFADVVRNAKNEQYVPSSVAPLVIAHTGMVGGGETADVEFTFTQPGVYDFICSFPGHWGTMQGKIVAE